MSSVVVRNGAPNWPAMVRQAKPPSSKKPAATNSDSVAASSSTYALSSATASLWLQTRQMKSKMDTETKKMTKFASKTTLARQCQHCQILYTNFHKCPVETEVDPETTDKL